LPRIFALVAAGKIDPLITLTLPLLEASKALTQLAVGGVEGKIGLVNP
jgi:NADPH:quinone reductase-like Zn-dependent oxidoreductase